MVFAILHSTASFLPSILPHFLLSLASPLHREPEKKVTQQSYWLFPEDFILFFQLADYFLHIN